MYLQTYYGMSVCIFIIFLKLYFSTLDQKKKKIINILSRNFVLLYTYTYVYACMCVSIQVHTVAEMSRHDIWFRKNQNMFKLI